MSKKRQIFEKATYFVNQVQKNAKNIKTQKLEIANGMGPEPQYNTPRSNQAPLFMFIIIIFIQT